MCDNTKDAIIACCVTLVLLTWAITGFVEETRQTEANRQISMEAIKNGYVECIVSRQDSLISKVLWKKSCKE